MSKKILLILAVMTIIAIPAFGQGTITANVSLNGTACSGAFVAVRTAPQALADAENGFGNTNGSGVYTTGTLADGTYYVEAWVEGYIAVEGSVTISGNNPSVSLNITESVTFNLVQSTAVPSSSPHRYFGGGDPSDGASPDFINLDPPGGPTFVDGTYGSTSNSGGGCTKVHMGVDLGTAHQVNQVIVAWYNDGGNWPAYEIQYANGTAIPGINDPAWTTWAAGRSANMNRPLNISSKGGWTSIITGSPVSARFWRVVTTTFDHLYLREFEVETSETAAAEPGTISGTVSVNGTPQAGARIGIKTSPSATADAAQYCTTGGGGGYLSTVLSPGTYYVGVWVDGYKMVETTVDVSATEPSDQDFNLTEAQDPNVAQGSIAIGGVWDSAGNFISAGAAGQPNGGSGTYIDGSRDNGYTDAGDFRTGEGYPVPPYYMGVDLLTDREVSQVFIDWYGSPFYPANGYAVQYAVDGEPDTWHDFYTDGGATPNPFSSTSHYEAISGVSVAARYWRIKADDTQRGWGVPCFLVQEFEVYSATEAGPAPYTISGTVTVNGVAYENAVVGVKTAPAATADAFAYYPTDVDGKYVSAALTPGAWYVGVWVDGYKIAETSVVVNATATAPADFDLTEAQSTDVAAGETAIGGIYLSDGTFVSAGDPGQPNGGNGTFLDGVRDNGYTEAGDERVPSDTGGTPMFMGVDLGSDKEVSQVFIDWYGDGYDPLGYKVQYATEAEPTTWLDFYEYDWTAQSAHPNAISPGHPGYFTPIYHDSAVSGRYWRIYAEKAHTGWGMDAFLVQEFEVYSSTAAPTPPSTISGTVTVNGVAQADAVVGVKATAGATADAFAYYTTGTDGKYVSDVLTPGTWYVGVWVDGYRMSETSVVVSDIATVAADFDLTEAQFTNAAMGKTGTGGVWSYGGVWQPATPGSGQENGGNGSNFLDGVFGNGYSYTIAGDLRVASGTGGTPMSLGVDLGLDCDVSQLLVVWLSDGANYYARNGYQVQYATEAAPDTWNTFYSYTGESPTPFAGSDFAKCEPISGSTQTGRYWRVYAEDGWGWGQATFVLQELQVYSAAQPPVPHKISGTVSVNGTLQQGAVVGRKTSSSATADADEYITTDENGYYEFPSLEDGTYYVGVWVDGYRMSETSVILAGADETASFDLTETQSANLAVSKTVFSSDSYWMDEPYPVQHVDGTFVNGARDDGYSWVGDLRATTPTHAEAGDPYPSTPMYMGVDLGYDADVSQALIQWFTVSGTDYMPRGGYKVQYATQLDPTTWNDWYTHVGDTSSFTSGYYEAISAPVQTGRYWRIYAEDGYGWNDRPAFLCQEFEVYSSTAPVAPPSAVYGTVTVNGVAQENAVVGVKTSPSATADAFAYYNTDVDGKFITAELTPGPWYVGVWVDGYKMQETSVVVSATEPVAANFNLTEAQEPNAALNQRSMGGFYYSDGKFYPISKDQLIPGGLNHPGSGGALVNGERDGSYVIAGDWRTTPVPPYVLGVDLGVNKTVSQVLVDWYGGGFYPTNYRVEYATDAAPATWVTWYSFGGGSPSPFSGNCYEAISGETVYARYWRVAADSTEGNWGGGPAFLAQEFEVYSSTPTTRINSIKGLEDGVTVSMLTKPVSFTPKVGGAYAGNFFYIEEPDRSTGIRVVNNSEAGQPVVGVLATISGIVRTDVTTGERYIDADQLTTGDAGGVGPLYMPTKVVNQDALPPGLLIRTSGKVQTLDPDHGTDYQWFTINDGYTIDDNLIPTKVQIALSGGDPSLSGQIAVGDFVQLTGIVSQENTSTRVILLRSFTVGTP